MSTFEILHEESTAEVNVHAWGTRTDDPFIKMDVRINGGRVEFITNDPGEFFDEVDRAKVLWEGRKQ